MVETMDPAVPGRLTNVPPGTLTVTAHDGRRLGVCEWGDPDGPPLFVLHGSPGSRYLHHPLGAYRDAHLRVITYDRPGYGVSTRQPGHRVVDAVADIVAVTDALAIGTFGVMGISGGGPRALAAAALLPDRIRRCATVVTAAPPTAPDLDFYAGMGEEDLDFWRAATQGADALDAQCAESMRWALNGLDDFSTGDAEGDARLEAAFREGFRQGSDGFRDDLAALGGDWGFRVEDVRVPARLMVARGDTSVPAGHWAWYRIHLPDADVVPVDGDHFGPREGPEHALVAWAGGSDAAVRPEEE